jgi:hypothetical protein
MFSGHIHRWRVAEPDGVLSNAKFPVICNPNMQRMEVTVSPAQIEINTFDTGGRKSHSHTISLK